MALVDLSLPLENGPSEREAVCVEYFDHFFGAAHMAKIFDVPAEVLPGGIGWAGERVTAITHAATHMDAPYHYGPLSAGRPAWRICDVPLEWCVGEGAVLDMTGKADGQAITVDDLAACSELATDDVPSIILIRTGASRYWGQADYPERGAGLDGSSTVYLLERGVRVIGIDAWGLDRPFSAMRADFRRTGDAAMIWPAHFAGRAQPYLQLEKLTNLDKLPPRGFRVFAFPVKITGAGAAWCRVVAETPE